MFSELLVVNRPHFIYDDAYPRKSATEFKDSVKSIVRLVKYPFVLIAALRNEEVASLQTIRDQEHPDDWLAEQLHVAIVSSTSAAAFIQIAISNDVPSPDAATIVNAVVDAFRREVIDVMRERRLNQHEELSSHIRTEEAEFTRLQQELRRRDKEITAAEKEHAAAESMMQVGFAGELKKQLGQLEWKILVGEVELERLRNSDQDNSVETPDADSLLVTAEASLAGNIALRDRVGKELEARQPEQRDLGSLWVDREAQAEKVAAGKARVAHLVDLEHKREVELQYEESHPPIQVMRKATAAGAGGNSPSDPPWIEPGVGDAVIAAPVVAALGSAFGIVIGATAAVVAGRLRRRRRPAIPTSDSAQ